MRRIPVSANALSGLRHMPLDSRLLTFRMSGRRIIKYLIGFADILTSTDLKWTTIFHELCNCHASTRVRNLTVLLRSSGRRLTLPHL